MRALVATFLLLAVAAAQAETAAPARGELLYSTHCIQCHTTQMHWRARHVARDWDTLRAQVRQWQGQIGLSWGEDDVTAVASYLNDTIYHFPHEQAQAPDRMAGRRSP